jgi:CheY-like chemotaxis protein
MPASSHQRHVLFLDDDAQFLESVGQLFALWSKSTWHVHLANSSAKALQTLSERKMDLVVLDIQMPVMDGMQLLQMLHRKYPDVSKVVMSGFGSEENRSDALKNGAELFLEKPRTSEGFETVFATLNELVSWQPQDGFRGVLRKVGLPEVIQLQCLGRKSSVLEVSTKSTRGHIYIENGSIIHAAMGDRKGEAAFNALLTLNGGEFNLRAFTAPPERTIDGKWEFLLMEAARLHDEIAEQNSVATAEQERAAATERTAKPVGDLDFLDKEARMPGDSASVDASAGPRSVEEFVVCSAQGDVLYEWQCAGIEMRVKLFDFLARQAAQFSQAFPLGNFDRLEIVGPQGRVVTQIHSDRRLFVRTAPLPEP